MLKSIDILLGLSVVMLMVSLIVTVLTEAAMTLMQTRGRNLRDGIASLLLQIHNKLSPAMSVEIAEKLLTHPLIKSAEPGILGKLIGKLLGIKYTTGFGTVIHREELTALLLELATGEGPHQLGGAQREALCELLKDNGISDAKEVMDNVRALTLQLEQAFPNLSNNERYAKAFLQEAKSSFLGKVNGWFDQTIDRVSDRFTSSARVITFFGSLAVALALQLDTAALVNRLSADPAFRQHLVEEAITVGKKPLPAVGNSIVPSLTDDDRQNLQTLATFDVIEIPNNLSDWGHRWNRDNLVMKLLGIVLTAMLLSLGAPFWYNALKNLIRLRSLIAQKDDDQRLSRQTNPVAAVDGNAAVPSGTPNVSLIAGERGDLTSVG